MDFYLGTHETGWLEQLDVPLFISAVRLRKRKRLPRAKGRWALDSGGFSVIGQHGFYPTGPREYAAEVKLWSQEVGGLEWAAIQDWMCEDVMLAKTGKSIEQHQQLTVNSWLALNGINAELPWVPVLQGQTVRDYHRHADLYERHTCTRLASLPRVGIGSVCRRQGTREAGVIVRSLYARGFRNLHGFGVKTLGLTGKNGYAAYLKSADSLAWSHAGRTMWNWFRVRLCEATPGRLRELRRMGSEMAKRIAAKGGAGDRDRDAGTDVLTLDDVLAAGKEDKPC